MEFGLGLARTKFKVSEFSESLQPIAEKVDRQARETAGRGDGFVSIDEAYSAAYRGLDHSVSKADLLAVRSEADKMQTRSALIREAALWPFAAVAVMISAGTGGGGGFLSQSSVSR